jgi:hypothetical protein
LLGAGRTGEQGRKHDGSPTESAKQGVSADRFRCCILPLYRHVESSRLIRD